MTLRHLPGRASPAAAGPGRGKLRPRSRKAGSHGARKLPAGAAARRPSPAPGPGPELSSAAPSPGCAGVPRQPQQVGEGGSPGRRTGTRKGKELTADGTRTRVALFVSRSGLLVSPPRISSSLRTLNIQETMSSYAHLVLKKKKKKGKKEKQLFHPLHVPCFHQINKASRREWTGAGGRPRCARRGFLRASRSSPASCTSTCHEFAGRGRRMRSPDQPVSF